ncbi:MAG: Asp-tRNA(Asn)/Glu-tRNA(Gln) amidotransferase subunit GatB [Firmicutes bacterium]|nr:Asp-tRNA(Asn)/Glu-tRNA(Gln) amidotransferase subunit GatB [Bacillota bacterium]
MAKRYQTVIGLEFHAELKTATKIFCSCPNTVAATPNSNVCPVCLGLPGVLPVLNRHAVELAATAGMALNCEVAPYSKFDRKNYFYPDLPKDFQTTQFPLPICKNGYLTIPADDGGEKKVRINRIHMEEDAGKLVHSGDSLATSNYSMPDYNRAAVPLIEIVTEPDISSAAEARAFGELLRLTLAYADVSDVRMEQGSLRCDVNISLKPWDSDQLGTKVEIKNLNSFRAVFRAIQYEEMRQADMLDYGETIVQETRLWNDATGETVSMRSKEDSHDYRYFPEPDLPPIVIDQAWMDEIRAKVPELPTARKARLAALGLSEKETDQIIASTRLARFFDEMMAEFGDAKTIANWLLGDFSRLMGQLDEDAPIPFPAADLSELLTVLKKGEINNNSAKAVLEEMFVNGGKPADIIKAKGFAQISDSSALLGIVQSVIANNPKPVEEFRGGKEKAFGFLLGAAMRESKGQGNPAVIRELLMAELKK